MASLSDDTSTWTLICAKVGGEGLECAVNVSWEKYAGRLARLFLFRLAVRAGVGGVPLSILSVKTAVGGSTAVAD